MRRISHVAVLGVCFACTGAPATSTGPESTTTSTNSSTLTSDSSMAPTTGPSSLASTSAVPSSNPPNTTTPTTNEPATDLSEAAESSETIAVPPTSAESATGGPDVTSGTDVSSNHNATENPATESTATDTAAADTAEVGPPAGTTPVKVYIAGDSTVSNYRDTESTTDQAGWGQMLHEYLSDLATVDNRAVGGTTSRSYIDFGHLDGILEDIAAGDMLLVQFGTNDGNKTATYDLDGQEIPYYLDPATDYKTYLGKYVDAAEGKGAHLVFVTPPPRNSAYCTGGNGTGGHAQAMRELAADRGIPLADLNTRTVDYLKAICPSPTPEDFFLLRSDGSVDGTHFQENGARIMAGFVADEVVTVAAPLAGYVKAN